MAKKTQISLKAQRFSELFLIAEMQFVMYTVRESGQITSLSKFNNNHLLLVAVDYCIAAIEAFINHIGYILVDDWGRHEAEKPNFWASLRKLTAHLAENDYNICFIESVTDSGKDYIEPFPRFEEFREIRRKIHHVRASIYDTMEYSAIDMREPEYTSKCEEMYSGLWPEPEVRDIEYLFEQYKLFVEKMHVSVKRKYDSHELIIRHDDPRFELLQAFLVTRKQRAAILTVCETEM